LRMTSLVACTALSSHCRNFIVLRTAIIHSGASVKHMFGYGTSSPHRYNAYAKRMSDLKSQTYAQHQ
jgi:hypothetical protein